MARPLFASADPADDVPVRLYVYDEAAGRRVPIELLLAASGIVGVVVDAPEFEEPPLGPAERIHAPDLRRTPFDADDFVTPSPVVPPAAS